MSSEIIQKPSVSICCMTYNQENFIRDCLDGFVMQQTTFPFEILVHEDASTDNTAAIVKEYESKYPHLFRCVYQTVNQFVIQNTLINILFPMVKGKYIAMCEGDDYWTDPLKLQKQVDFLEANPDYAICFHNCEVVYWDNNKEVEKEIFHKNGFRDTTNIVELIVDEWFMPTASVVFRNVIKKLPNWFSKSMSGDIPLYLLLAKHGKIKYHNEIMSVYRKHPQGISLFHTNNQVELSTNRIEMYLFLDEEFNSEYRIWFLEKIIHHYSNILMVTQNIEIMVLLRKYLFEYFNYNRNNYFKNQEFKTSVIKTKQSYSFRLGNAMIAPFRKLKFYLKKIGVT